MLVGDGALVIDVADPIDVIEQAMRYFYAMGVQGVKAKAPVEEVGKYFKMAMQAASMAAPYRHPRLSAVKHVDGLGQPGSIDGIRADARNKRTVWQSAQKSLRSGGIVVQAVEAIDVVENVMRYFYTMGFEGMKASAPVEDVQKCFKMAIHAAGVVLPYRHPRLSAVKHVDASLAALEGIRADATPDEIRAEIAKRVKQLRDKGYLEALPEPEPAQNFPQASRDGIAPAAAQENISSR